MRPAFLVLIYVIVAACAQKVSITPTQYKGLKFIGAQIRAPVGGKGTPVASRYYLSQDKKSWKQARNECQEVTNFEGSLLQIDDAEEDRGIMRAIGNAFGCGAAGRLWTGGIRVKGKEWSWFSNKKKMDYQNFGSKPWATPDSSAYLSLERTPNASYEWSPRKDSSEKYAYICEIDGSSEEARTCYDELDLAILMDRSGSINFPNGPAGAEVKNFPYAKDFVAKLAGAFPPPSRVSIITFSNDAQLEISLASGLAAKQVSSRVLSLGYPRGRTNTAAAIRVAVEDFSKNQRPGIPMKMVTLTDGLSNKPSETADAAQRAIDTNIQLFSVGVGQNTRQVELLGLAGGKAGNRFDVNSFPELLKKLRPVSIRACNE